MEGWKPLISMKPGEKARLITDLILDIDLAVLFRWIHRKQSLRLFCSYARNNNMITVPQSSLFQ